MFFPLDDRICSNNDANLVEHEQHQIYRRPNRLDLTQMNATKIDPQRYFSPNIVCDRCNRFIYDIRFHCQICKNFDLCNECVKKYNSHPHCLTPLYNRKSIDATDRKKVSTNTFIE